MVEITEEELEKNFEEYVEKCENGESFIIARKDGRRVMMIPAKDLEDAQACVSMNLPDDEDDFSIYNDHDDAS
tara:strand:- start:1208 stop:1426 length:219 start_codon:yes stop_codon:yes gene_type:complete